MPAQTRRIPPGPAEKYDTTQDLLVWLCDHFERFGDIYKASVYGTDAYVVSEPTYVHYILCKNWQNYKKGQAIKRIGLLLGNGLMVSEGGLWKRQRRMIQPAFHDKVIRRLARMMREANAVLLEKWECAAREKQAVNVTRDLSLMVLQVVVQSIFGDDYGQVAPQFGILSDEPARNLEFAQAFRSLGRMVGQVAAQRRENNVVSSDILGILIEARDRESGRAMSDSQLVSEIMTLVVAGHETTASTLNWIWYLLSENPEVEGKLSAEVSSDSGTELPDVGDLSKFTYARQVIDEALRLYPPGWLMTRKAINDDQLGDYFVPAGTEIYISPYLIQRHPGLWETPDSYNPDRFGGDQSRDRHLLTMLPFSAGPRKCIGESFALIEMQLHLVIIARRLRLRSVTGNRVELEAGVNLRNKYDFTMIPEIKTPVALTEGS